MRAWRTNLRSFETHVFRRSLAIATFASSSTRRCQPWRAVERETARWIEAAEVFPPACCSIAPTLPSPHSRQASSDRYCARCSSIIFGLIGVGARRCLPPRARERGLSWSEAAAAFLRHAGMTTTPQLSAFDDASTATRIFEMTSTTLQRLCRCGRCVAMAATATAASSGSSGDCDEGDRVGMIQLTTSSAAHEHLTAGPTTTTGSAQRYHRQAHRTNTSRRRPRRLIPVSTPKRPLRTPPGGGGGDGSSSKSLGPIQSTTSCACLKSLVAIMATTRRLD